MITDLVFFRCPRRTFAQIRFFATSCSLRRENTASPLTILLTFSSNFKDGRIGLCMNRLKISNMSPAAKRLLSIAAKVDVSDFVNCGNYFSKFGYSREDLRYDVFLYVL